MSKLKKTMAVLLCILTLLSVCCVAAGCPQKEEEEKPLPEIKIVVYNRDGTFREEFVFTDTYQLHTEIEYDGGYYYVYALYKLPTFKPPTLSSPLLSEWRGAGDDCFRLNLSRVNYKDPLEGYHAIGPIRPSTSHMYYIKDKGQYMYDVEVTNSEWAGRRAILYIDIV